jgi:hypothetical protein
MGLVRKSRTNWVVTHQNEPEVLLIRVGHHLWAWAKSASMRYQKEESRIFEMAWVSVIEAKAAFRKPMQESRIKNNEAFRVKAAARLAEKRSAKRV